MDGMILLAVVLGAGDGLLCWAWWRERRLHQRARMVFRRYASGGAITTGDVARIASRHTGSSVRPKGLGGTGTRPSTPATPPHESAS